MQNKIVLEFTEEEFMDLLTVIALPVEVLKMTDEFVGSTLTNIAPTLDRIISKGEEEGIIEFPQDESEEEVEEEENKE